MIWQERAACARLELVDFFPDESDGRAVASAKAVCEGCPVRIECLETGMEETGGIWGGMTSAERELIRSGRPAPALSCAGCGAPIVQEGARGRRYCSHACGYRLRTRRGAA